jgi:hypothetical protein
MKNSSPEVKINGKEAKSEDWGSIEILIDPPFKGK